MSRHRKNNSLLMRRIPTAIGTLVVLLAIIPVILISDETLKESATPSRITIPMVKGATTVNGQYMNALYVTPVQEGVPANEPQSSCPPGTICIPTTPQLTCIPRPPCFDATGAQHCTYTTPPNATWCPPTPMLSGSPTPTPTLPPGCVYRRICMMLLRVPCTTNDPSCTPCRTVRICPSETPPAPSISSPLPTCQPHPTCNPRLGIACRVYWPCITASITPPIATGAVTTPSLGQTHSVISAASQFAGFMVTFFKSIFGL